MSECGAAAGSVLCGFGLSNQGLRLQVLQDQVKGDGGPVQGKFLILDVGENMHARALARLRHMPTDAAEVLGTIRQDHAGCANVANSAILFVEPPVTPEGRRPPRWKKGTVSGPDQYAPESLAPVAWRLREGDRSQPELMS